MNIDQRNFLFLPNQGIIKKTSIQSLHVEQPSSREMYFKLIVKSQDHLISIPYSTKEEADNTLIDLKGQLFFIDLPPE